MKKIYMIMCVAIASLCFSCTTIHEYPEGEGVDLSLINVDLSLLIDMSLEEEVTTPQTYAALLSQSYDIRYIVDIYRIADSYAETVGSLERRIVKTESTIIENGKYHIDENVKLHAGKYNVLVWVDFVQKGSTEDYYYDTSNLHNVRIKKIAGVYQGYHVTKDAFSANKEMNLIPYAHQRNCHYEMEIPVERPFAVYQIVTTDINKYKEEHNSYSYSQIRPDYSNVYYGLYFPMGFNVYYQVPDAFTAGVDYKFNVVEQADGTEAILASDFVFVDSKETFYYVSFNVNTPDGTLINQTKELKVKLNRNKMTIIKDEFLTKEIDDGNIGIDPGFDDEIIVPIG